jgi:hypothetical protein
MQKYKPEVYRTVRNINIVVVVFTSLLLVDAKLPYVITNIQVEKVEQLRGSRRSGKYMRGTEKFRASYVTTPAENIIIPNYYLNKLEVGSEVILIESSLLGRNQIVEFPSLNLRFEKLDAFYSALLPYLVALGGLALLGLLFHATNFGFTIQCTAMMLFAFFILFFLANLHNSDRIAPL